MWWTLEDVYFILPLAMTPSGAPLVVLAAVFDGHGPFGHIAAALASEAFRRVAQAKCPPSTHPMDDNAITGLFVSLFEQADHMMNSNVHNGEQLTKWSGCTATAAFIDIQASKVAIAHVGDSSAVLLGSGGTVEFRSRDHVVDEEASRRCVERGGVVRTDQNGARRIFLKDVLAPGIMMARSLGDRVAHDLGVRSDPDIVTNLAFGPGSCLILASDGVWDKMEPRSAAGVCAAAAGDPQAAARKISETARRAWPVNSSDDITTAVFMNSFVHARELSHGAAS